MEAVAAAGGAGLTGWQAAALSGAAGWVWAASHYDLTRRARALAQPWVTRRIHAETPSILTFQRLQHKLLDNFFSVLSCVVSVPFYTGFLPLLFWSGHGKLARQMTLLLAFCDYLGNAVKDLVSAPRPCSPPVRRVTATEDEKENAMEYGLPSSHALNTVCLMGYMLHYVLTYGPCDGFMITMGLSLAFMLVTLIGIARVYLGMHSVTDVIAGISFGIVILAFWLVVHDHVDAFVVSGQNVTFFWASLSLVLCFAYPKPEFPTPSFEFHTAFNGVAFGIDRTNLSSLASPPPPPAQGTSPRCATGLGTRRGKTEDSEHADGDVSRVVESDIGTHDSAVFTTMAGGRACHHKAAASRPPRGRVGPRLSRAHPLPWHASVGRRLRCLGPLDLHKDEEKFDPVIGRNEEKLQ